MCILHLLVLLVIDHLLLVLFLGINTVFEVYQDAGMLFSFCIILFIESVKIFIQCVSFPRIFNKSGFIPSGPGDFFICCVTSAVVICESSMYPIYLTFATITFTFFLHILLSWTSSLSISSSAISASILSNQVFLGLPTGLLPSAL